TLPISDRQASVRRASPKACAARLVRGRLGEGPCWEAMLGGHNWEGQHDVPSICGAWGDPTASAQGCRPPRSRVFLRCPCSRRTAPLEGRHRCRRDDGRRRPTAWIWLYAVLPLSVYIPRLRG